MILLDKENEMKIRFDDLSASQLLAVYKATVSDNADDYREALGLLIDFKGNSDVKTKVFEEVRNRLI
jgi:hypothetical protein